MALRFLTDLVGRAWRAGKWLYERITPVRLVEPVPAPPVDPDALPATGLRGLRTQKFVNGKVISYEAFMPDSKTARRDGYSETSVNWEDGGGDAALSLLKRNHNNVIGGIARFNTAHVREVMAWPNVHGNLSMERREEPENPHHGNLLFVTNVSKQLLKAIANALALACQYIPPDPPDSLPK